MTDQPATPIELRESGGVHVYYAMPVLGGGMGVFEHVSTHSDQTYAQAQISNLEAADAHRRELAAEAHEVIAELGRTAEGDSNDAEIEAGHDCADVLSRLLVALQESCLIWPVAS